MTNEMKKTGLTLETVTEAYDKVDAIEEILVESFPVGERLPMDKLLAITNTDFGRIYAIVDDGKVVGFIIVASKPDSDWVYGINLAVSSSCRGRNYGSRALKLLQEIYKEKIIFACIESLVTDCDNYDQRVARARFYKRNGFHITDITFDATALRMGFMTIITNNPEVSDDKLCAFLDEASHLLGGDLYEQYKHLMIRI